MRPSSSATSSRCRRWRGPRRSPAQLLLGLAPPCRTRRAVLVVGQERRELDERLDVALLRRRARSSGIGASGTSRIAKRMLLAEAQPVPGVEQPASEAGTTRSAACALRRPTRRRGGVEVADVLGLLRPRARPARPRRSGPSGVVLPDPEEVADDAAVPRAPTAPDASSPRQSASTSARKSVVVAEQRLGLAMAPMAAREQPPARRPDARSANGWISSPGIGGGR